jgi:hypothetical protein
MYSLRSYVFITFPRVSCCSCGNKEWVRPIVSSEVLRVGTLAEGESLPDLDPTVLGVENDGDSNVEDEDEDDSVLIEPVDGVPKVVKRKVRLTPCSSTHDNARHRVESRGWLHVTAGCLLAWFGILVFAAARGVETVEDLWKTDCGMGVAWARNAMTRDAFRQIRQYLHFTDDNKLPQKKSTRHHKLQKIKWFLDELQKQMLMAHELGEHICIDESMIKCVGRAISWTQYMPTKPIKHGMKVFALTRAKTGFLVAFEVYTGASVESMAGPTDVVFRLVNMANLAGRSAGRVLYTDNWYTSLKCLTMVYKTFGMFMVGTHKMTKKVKRLATDCPFHRLSNGALNMVPRGWMRTAQKKVLDHTGKFLFWAQATVWKDRKEVAFLHNWLKGSETPECFRWRKGEKGKETLPCHVVSIARSIYMGGVDREDKDSAKWGISIKTNRWCLRIIL